MNRLSKVAAMATIVGIAGSASADFTGFASFVRIADNGDRVVDIVATMSESNGRIMNVFDAQVSGTFIQDATISNGGFAPDGVYNTRSSTTDSFLCIGAYNGTSQNGEYYGSSRTYGDEWYLGGWDSASNTVPEFGNGPKWGMPSASYNDSMVESLANFSGTRIDSGLSSGSNYGVWVAHLVMDASQTSFTFDAWVAGIKGTGGGFQAYFGTFDALGSTTPAVPGVGGVAALAGVGLAGRRRRR